MDVGLSSRVWVRDLPPMMQGYILFWVEETKAVRLAFPFLFCSTCSDNANAQNAGLYW